MGTRLRLAPVVGRKEQDLGEVRHAGRTGDTRVLNPWDGRHGRRVGVRFVREEGSSRMTWTHGGQAGRVSLGTVTSSPDTRRTTSCTTPATTTSTASEGSVGCGPRPAGSGTSRLSSGALALFSQSEL